MGKEYNGRYERREGCRDLFQGIRFIREGLKDIEDDCIREGLRDIKRGLKEIEEASRELGCRD